MEVTYCISTYNNEEGLYLTVFSALAQLEKSNLNWEILIVADGGTPQKWENVHSNVHCIRLTGSNRTGSPQGTRNMGIRNAQYKNVLCVDSHVIVSDIEKWVLEHEKIGAALSFPAMIGTSLEMFKIYGNQMDFDNCFWNVLTYAQPKSLEPFRVCQCAHSAFIVDRNWYLCDGGYTLEQRGYGAEEPWLALLAWMMGQSVWMIPEIWHSHYMPSGRNDGAGQRPDFARNFMLCSYVMGGQEYLEKTQRYFGTKLIITPEVQRRRDMICQGPYHGDLNMLRTYFKREKIVGGCD